MRQTHEHPAKQLRLAASSVQDVCLFHRIRMPDRISEDMPDRMSEGMTDRIAEDIPDRMPDRISEDMPDR